jgi:hypothetical protein
MLLPARNSDCPCVDGCPSPGCTWDGLSCVCPAHGLGTPGNEAGFEGSCDECPGCKAARNPEI